MTTIVCAVLGSSVISTVINRVFNWFDQKNRRNKIDRLLLLDALKRQGVEYINNGHVTTKELQSHEEYYRWYKACGGDGFADAIHKKVESLPIIEDAIPHKVS